MIGASSAGIGTLLLLLTGILPLGLPPEPENPVLSYAAPEECLYYASWSTMAKPNAASENHTERLLAEPELKEFADALEQTFSASIVPQLRDLTPDQQKLMRLAVPQAVRTIITRGTTVYVSKASPNGEGIAVEGGLVLHAGEDAATLRTQIVQLLEMVKIPTEEVQVGSVKFTRVAPTPDFPNPITFGVMGPYLLAGVGDKSVEKLIDRLKAKKIPVWLTKLREQLPVERRGSESFINVQQLVEQYLPMAGPDGEKVATSLGVKSLGVFTTATGLDKQGMVTRTLLTVPGPAVGLLQLAEGEGIKDFHLRHIPTDAAVAVGYSVNATKLYDLVLNVLRENGADSDQEVAQFNEQFRETTGMGLREDLLPALGDSWTFHMSPVDGWLAGFTASVAVTDKAKLDLLNTKIVEMARRRGGPPGFGIGMQKVGTNVIYSARMAEAPFQPAWCVTNDRLHIALFPTALKPILADPAVTEPLFGKGSWFKQLQTADPVLSVSHQDAAKSFEMTYSYVAMLLPMMLQAANQQAGDTGLPRVSFDAGKLPSARSIHRHLQPATAVVRRSRAGIEMETHQTMPTMDMSTAGPVAVALLLPAVQAARTAARRIQGVNNVKQIVLGVHNFHDTYNGMPPAYIPDANDKPGLSWRVAILPFIEQQNLYNQFKMDEPWDSEHNKKLIPLMPKVYRSETSRAEPGKATYLGIGGPKGMFVPPAGKGKMWKPGITFAAVTDGLSNTAMIVEVADDAAVIWTKPDDFIPNEKDPFKGVGFVRNGGSELVTVGMADGSVRSLTRTISAKTWLLMLDKADGMVVEIP